MAEEKITYDEFLKQNVIEVARKHRATCDDHVCTVSLFALALLLEKAGIKLTEQEYMEFF